VNSKLLDLDDDHVGGYHKDLVDITLESFENDDECEAKTRFTKGAIATIIGALNHPYTFRFYFAPPRYYKFKLESLVIYMLRKMSTARTHADLRDSEFGGSSARWAIGYKWIVKLFDRHFAHLIGLLVLRH
jgi:hypothetical protein